MAGNFDETRAKAEFKIRKAEREALDRAMAEYAAASENRQIKSAKLKELRLKKEAEELAAGIPGSTPVVQRSTDQSSRHRGA